MDIKKLDRIIVFFEGVFYGILIYSLPRIIKSLKETFQSIKKDSTAGTDESLNKTSN